MTPRDDATSPAGGGDIMMASWRKDACVRRVQIMARARLVYIYYEDAGAMVTRREFEYRKLSNFSRRVAPAAIHV